MLNNSGIHCLVIFLLAISFFSQYSFAQHGEAAPPASEHGSTSAPHEKEFSGQQSDQWISIQKSLLDLKIKTDAQKIIVADLLKSKKHNDSKISQDEIALLKKEHERLQALTNEYNQMLVDFQFRFPENGLESGRKYIRLENQSIEEMENAPTIQGRLKRLNKKIKKQYQEDSPQAELDSHNKEHGHEKSSAGSKKSEGEKTNIVDVTDQIILVK